MSEGITLALDYCLNLNDSYSSQLHGGLVTWFEHDNNFGECQHYCFSVHIVLFDSNENFVKW